jgi:hypothetical protein
MVTLTEKQVAHLSVAKYEEREREREKKILSKNKKG